MPQPTVFTYIECRPDGDDANANVVGGRVIRTTAAGALNTGDSVLFSAASKVNKSATAADLAGFAGVVVGGKLTKGRVPSDLSVVSAATDADGDEVLVQIDGICYAMAGGTVTPGTHFSVIGDSTAGRVIAGTTAGVRVGTPITAGSVGALFKMLIRQR